MSDQWQRPRPGRQGIRGDSIMAALVAVGAATSTLLYSRVGFYDEPAPVWLSVLCIAGISVPLAFRRLFPEIVAVVISVAFFVSQQFSVPELLFTQISLFLAIYTVGAWGRNRRTATILRLAITVFPRATDATSPRPR